MKKFIKFLPIALSLVIFLIANKALADIMSYPSSVPLRLAGLTGPVSLPLVFGINFIINLFLIFCFCYFYLNYKKIGMMIGGTFIVTLIGLVIDIISSLVAFIVSTLSISPFEPFPHARDELLSILFLILFFLISFIMLWLMYRLILKGLFGLSDRKKIMISSLALAILTNPVWLLILLILSLFVPKPVPPIPMF